jgi:beta-mannan synthase
MFLTWPMAGNFAVNYDVCLMTRIQKMSLDYHFKVEQESGSSMHSFFGFNGKIEPTRGRNHGSFFHHV